jgi:hypothetical protein
LCTGITIWGFRFLLAVYRGEKNKPKWDKKSQAANQAVLRISRHEFARYQGSTAFGRYYLYWNTFLPASFFFRNIIGSFWWQLYSTWFMHGDLNPAMVVDADRGLVAAFTDMRTRPGKPAPVIKIFKEKLHLLPSPAKNGDTFAAVSAYSPRATTRITERELPFYLLTVDCVIQDEVKCEFAKAKIPDAHWLALQIGL